MSTLPNDAATSLPAAGEDVTVPPEPAASDHAASTDNAGYNRQAKRGIRLLLVRQVALQAITFGGGVVLARALDPAAFGLYVIALFLVSLFSMLGDFGLAPSLIQRREELTARDLQVGFTLQQGLVTVVVTAVWLAAPWLAGFYPDAPPETPWLVRALSLNLFFATWRTASKLQLERRLQYDRISIAEVAEVLIYQGTAVGLALAGYGVWSFAWAALASGAVGSALTYALCPWPVRLAFDRATAAGLIRYGVPFQLQSVLNGLGGWVTPVIVGGWIGPSAVGLLTWASSNGRKPLVLVDSVWRVAFPHLSRVQHDRAEVERVVVRYLTLLLLPAGLWIAVIVAAGRPIVESIYTAKWLPALPALALFAVSLVGDIASSVFAVTCNALGLVNRTTAVAAARSAAHVALSVALLASLGGWLGDGSFTAVAIAYAATTTAFAALYGHTIGGGFSARVTTGVLWLAWPTLLACALGWVAEAFLSGRVGRVQVAVFSTAVVGSTYAAAAWALAPGWLIDQARAALAAGSSRIPFRTVGAA